MLNMNIIKTMDLIGGIAHGVKISRGKEYEKFISEQFENMETVVKVEREKVYNVSGLQSRKNNTAKIDIVVTYSTGEIAAYDVKSAGEAFTVDASSHYNAILTALNEAHGTNLKEYAILRVTDGVNDEVKSTYENVGMNSYNAHTFFGMNIKSLVENRVAKMYKTAAKTKYELGHSEIKLQKNGRFPSQKLWENLDKATIVKTILTLFGVTKEEYEKIGKEVYDETGI